MTGEDSASDFSQRYVFNIDGNKKSTRPADGNHGISLMSKNIRTPRYPCDHILRAT